ncbi:TadE/TadG family type IV pilus assembly protein [Pseudarthrobacter sp. NPDC058196]|uniref:TadE/TadG family type IV pilus assembly protein n=1 Tax=Pseudarthrobacter sp. NPDC058196 TaxID=3346376 RepID=UPI0036D8D180
MQPSSRDAFAPGKPPDAAIGFRIRTRLADALCREPATYAGQRPGNATASGRAVKQPRPDRGNLQWHFSEHERGSAVVEFTFLALLLMVPLVYFVITVGQIQGGSFAVVGAADQAAKVYVAQSDPVTAQAAAEGAVSLALSDFGHEPGRANMTTSCEPADCTAAGSAVTVTVSLSVPLPFLPFAEGLSATNVQASATQLVGRYR